MNVIKNWISSLVRRARTAADRRLDHAMTCPECGHDAREASAECECWDLGCLCVEFHETQR